MKTITIHAKEFSGRGIETVRCVVDSDGSVLVWDSVAGHYTRCHILGVSAQRRVRAQAIR